MHTKFERRCVACRANKQQNEMLRIEKLENDFLIDLTHKIGGCGAYICKDKACLAQTIKKRLLNKAFKMNVGENIYSRLVEYEQNS